uniref:Uncharacterized protein n=1 Tax=Panagrolaimus sp. PS1159 TaxID=55785 RepID=A0AC35G3U2_9BILA
MIGTHFLTSFFIAFLAFAVIVDANFVLSCRIISSICQEDEGCLAEMNVKFPNCYTEHVKRSTPDAKRAKAYKLLNLLYKVERIPVG